MRRFAFMLMGLSMASGCTWLPKARQEAEPAAEAKLSAGRLSNTRAAQACLVTAKALDAKGHDGEALVEYERARQFDPTVTEVSPRLAVLYDRVGDAVKAEREYRQALADDPDNPDLLIDAGYFFYHQGQPEEAEKLLKKALTIHPGHHHAWANLGLVLVKLGRPRESYAAFVRVVRPAQAHANIGVLLARDGHFEEARASIIHALALEPNLAPARQVLAQLNGSPATMIAPAAPAAQPTGLQPVSAPPPPAQWPRGHP